MIKVAVSGYFNPLHKGHVRMIREAKRLGDHLTVIVNSDQQVILKGSVPFMTDIERCEIISALRDVDDVIVSIDDDKTVCKTLRKVRPDIFANGGDRRNESDIPEAQVCEDIGASMVFNVGGDKIQSSSELLASI